MKICFNDTDVKIVKGQRCNICSLGSNSIPCRWINICGNNPALNFEPLSEVFKV
jgi:hypothetical protein